MSTDQTYIGQELTLFAHATNWKNYYTSIIRPYFGSHVVSRPDWSNNCRDVQERKGMAAWNRIPS
jgi:hypothetical protein